MDNLIIGVVPYSMIDLIWDKVEPLLDKVVVKSPEDISSNVVKAELKLGRKALSTVSRGTEIIAINVLDIRTLDTGLKVLYIPITAGSEMENWLDQFLEIAIAIAKDNGCVELRGMAVRNGWLHKLKPRGWEELFTTIRYKIGE